MSVDEAQATANAKKSRGKVLSHSCVTLRELLPDPMTFYF